MNPTDHLRQDHPATLAHSYGITTSGHASSRTNLEHQHGAGGLALISSGMICALGNTSLRVSACVRAGISGYQASGILNRRNKNIVMAQVPEAALIPLPAEMTVLQQRLPGHTFMVQLAATALLDCLSASARQYPLPLFMACPEPLPQKKSRLETSFLHDVKNLSRCNIDIANSRYLYEGRAGGIAAIDVAYNYFRSTGNEFALIGGVDSYRHFNSQIEYLDKTQRLLAEGATDGFAPGEAASFLLVASPAACKKYSLAPKLYIGQPGCGLEKGHRFSTEPYRGDGLSQAFATALAAAIPNIYFSSIYSSLNGESYGAKELGVAQIRHQRFFNDPIRVQHPTDCFGDIGAATAPMLIGLIAHNEKNPCLVYCSADGPQRGAVCVWPPDYA